MNVGRGNPWHSADATSKTVFENACDRGLPAGAGCEMRYRGCPGTIEGLLAVQPKKTRSGGKLLSLTKVKSDWAGSLPVASNVELWLRGRELLSGAGPPQLDE